jgi:LysR family transcriptional regulator, regulator of abg operon
MTLQQLADFLAIVQHGSVHAAARATGQTQPALTKSLRRLEGALGTSLLDRHARGMQPNPFGQTLLAHARRVVTEAQRARDAIAQSLEHRRGRVEFGISAAASILLAPPAIRRFRREYPEVDLRSRGGLYHSLAPMLRDGQCDFFISPLPAGPVDPRFASRTLIESQMVLVARREHPLARVRTLQAVREARFVIGGPRGQPGAGIVAVFEQAGFDPPQIEIQTDGLIDSAAMVAGSDCLALLPAALMRSGLLRERLVVLPIANALPAYEVALFERAHEPQTPAAAALANQFERESAYLRSP